MSISQNTLDVLQDAPQPNMQPDEFNLKAFAFAAVLYTLGLEINETVATLNQASTTSESGDTLTIGLGAKNLTVEAGKSFAVGMTVRIADTVTGTRWMNGDVTAYDPLTGNLSVNVSAVQGSGNANVWTISQSFGGLTAGSVDTDKLAGLAVTAAKIADLAITTGKIDAGAATLAKLDRTGSAGKILMAQGINQEPTWEDNPKIGQDQSWGDVTASRAFGVTYTNSTDKPIMVYVSGIGTVSTGNSAKIFVNGIGVGNFGNYGSGSLSGCSFIVPAGGTYSVGDAINMNLYSWVELK